MKKETQKNVFNNRKNNTIDNGIGLSKKKLKIAEKILRNDFSRDRDRILFSKSFRRLEHKAQIYSHQKGDHFRTRLTHSLEVSQIARSLSRNLGANEDLVEAISLGHDLGHTPFGHQGERTLDDIMSGKDQLSGKLNYQIDFGGFKHNFNSLRILDQIEKKYPSHKGLNLTWQVLEGILKHTKIKRHKEKTPEECNKCNKCWKIERFIDFKEGTNKDFKKMMHLDKQHSVTIEGQIVALADEIAQRQHDLDDGLRDSNLGLNYDEVLNQLLKSIGKIQKANKRHIGSKLNQDIKILNQLEKKFQEYKKTLSEKKESYDDYILYIKTNLVRDIIEYFILDATNHSYCTMKLSNLYKKIDVTNPDFRLEDKIISFSNVGAQLNDAIEEYISNRIVNSFEVNRFDGKAIYIIRQLFKAYFTNPRQMPSFILEQMKEKINDNCKTYYDIKINEKPIKDISFKTSHREDVNNLIKLLKLDLSGLNIKNIPSSYFDTNKLDNDKIQSIANYTSENFENDDEKHFKCIIENNYVYLSSICDYISGMTDNFAKAEYEKLY